jgi:hypothetical protein
MEEKYFASTGPVRAKMRFGKQSNTVKARRRISVFMTPEKKLRLF